MHFAKLRLAGFKSFVDPSELVIEPGLTGIVGPNGCGKSNLVEALRWVMGESSAKQMRGAAMDDVIFSGTTNRPARNIAEVQLVLDNAERDAPAAFNEGDEIEVVRRIERETGSRYAINGRDVRMRDVQLLFADVATGAHSSALVSQGQIASIINSKPAERRRLLEEAAGITGLHSRRHEAELRLKAAEANLVRLEDVVRALETQFQGLRRQARQASRYRNLSGHIRRTQALLYHLRWQALEAAIADAAERLGEAERTVAETAGAAARASTAEEEAAAALPGLRGAEAEAAAALRRLEVERENLEAEERRIAERRTELENRLSQIAGDIIREEALEADAGEAAARLVEEARKLEETKGRQQDVERAALAALDEANRRLAEIETRLDGETRELAVKEAEKTTLERRLEELGARAARIAERLAGFDRERILLEPASRDAESLAADERRLQTLREAREAKRRELEAAATARQRAQAAEMERRDATQAAETRRDRLRAEDHALAQLLGVDDPLFGPPIVDQVAIENGLEQALGAAFGDELAASTNPEAPVHWVELADDGPLSALPEGARALSGFVRAPSALKRCLSQIGVVEPDQGPALRDKLKPGQCLVSAEGALWRWDGYTVAAEAPVAAAKRLKQRKRLAALKDEIAEAERRADAAAQAFAAAREAARAAQAAEEAARGAFQAADEAWNKARDEHSERLAEGAAARSRLASLAEAEAALQAELAETEAEAALSRDALRDFPDLDESRAGLERLRHEQAQARQALAERKSAHDRLAREAQYRAERRAAIARETASWTSRAEGARGRLAELKERRAAADSELGELSARPAEVERQRHSLLEAIVRAEAARKDSADALAQAETRAAEFDKAAREAERIASAAREDRVRAEAARDGANRQRDDLATQIAERLECGPGELAGLAELKDGQETPSREQAEAKLERLLRERDTMGPVNLRAEEEARELEERLAGLAKDRADLEAAIARLRQGIASLNQEGRERMVAAFTRINENFKQLFTELFGGGKADLRLVESDDPLEAGLELVAAPPGKQTRVLSLLSGGEQALTALTLLFAVFLANPAPICVLDEADAALDDANVERYCRLIQRIAKETGTRFIVITHNRITMARVDRLFGVTMAERGVSQLVSVDLAAAEGLRESA